MRRLPSIMIAAVMAVALYAAAVRTGAQEPAPYPFAVGEHIALFSQPTGYVSCTVKQIRGTFVACEPPERISLRFDQPKVQDWYNLATVSSISTPIAKP